MQKKKYIIVVKNNFKQNECVPRGKVKEYPTHPSASPLFYFIKETAVNALW